MASFACKLLTAALVVCCVSPAVNAQRPSAPKDSGAASASAPRTADGHLDLSGLWNGANMRGGAGGGNQINPTNEDYLKTDANGFEPSILATRGGTFTNFERDNTLVRRMGTNKPKYKPEYWERVRNLDQNGNEEDPAGNCMPLGVPRAGIPTQIAQTPDRLIFLYTNGAASPAFYRVIPIDARKHTPLEDLDGSYNGESIGHWEGDTMVIDSIGFNTATWLDIEGYFHSENMHVVERLTRSGNSLTWQATVEDPDVLLEPWIVNSRTVQLNTKPEALLQESPPCSERDYAHTVTKEHH